MQNGQQSLNFRQYSSLCNQRFKHDFSNNNTAKVCLFPDFKMATKKMNSYDFVLLLHCKKNSDIYIYIVQSHGHHADFYM